MGYIILIIVLALLSISAYRMFDSDCFSPSFVVIITYLFSTFFAFVAYIFNMWNNVNNLSTFVIVSIVIAMISFCVAEFLVRKLLFNKDIKRKMDRKYRVYNFNSITYYTMLFLVIITGLLIYVNLAKLTGEWFNIPKMISTYRTGSLFAYGEDIYKLNFFVMQMFRCIDILGLILIYIVVNNILLTKKVKPNIKYAVLLLLICFISLLISGRTLIIKYVIAFILCFNILKFKYEGKTFRFKEIVKPLLICVLIGIPLFYLSLSFLGRSKNHGIVNYTTFYFGSPVASLETIVSGSDENIVNTNNNFGANTFVGLQTILNKINVKVFNQPNQFKWIKYSHELSNNVFTGIYPYITDFGLVGVFICQLIFGCFVSLSYYLAKYKRNPIYIIFLCMIGIWIFDSFRSEKMFTNIVSLNMIMYVVYLLIILYVLSKITQTKEVSINGK